MLAKGNRLNKKKDIQKVFKKGKWAKNDFLAIKWVPNNLEKSRFAFIISRKVSKKAVSRNRIKRRLRGKIKKELPHLKKGIDYIIIVNPGAEKQKREAMAQSLNKIFVNAKLFSKNETNSH